MRPAHDPAGSAGARSACEPARPLDGPLTADKRTTAAATGDGGKPIGGELNAAIARSIVRIHRERVGRGPASAHAFFHRDMVVVVMAGVLVAAERSLLAGGHQDTVSRLRLEIHEAIGPELIAAVERLTDRRVLALMGDTTPTADMACHVFVLDEPIETQPAPATGRPCLAPLPPPAA